MNEDKMIRPTIAIAAIMKNEGPYILEWLAWHKLLGIDKFYIADNESDDGLTQILSSLAEQGEINHIPFPTPNRTSPQAAAYQYIIDTHGEEADWILFIDGDEFLQLTEPNLSIHDFVAKLHDDIGAVCLNWAVYGSSSRTKAGVGFVTSRFISRSTQDRGVNRHYKSVIRTKAVQDVGQNVHHIEIQHGYRRVNTRSHDLELFESKKGLSSSVVWDCFRINHYVIKSWSEFWLKKVSRGRATRAPVSRSHDFFYGHDLNDVYDPVAVDVHIALNAKVQDLKTHLSHLPRWIKNLDRSIADIVPPPEDYRAVGNVDRATLVDGFIVLEGWALTPGRKHVENFNVYIDGTTVSIAEMSRLNRLDVRRAYPGSDLYCGYKMKINAGNFSNLPKSIEVEIKHQPGMITFGKLKKITIR